MTSATYTNEASGNADVDVMAGVVHGGINYYQVAPDASPEEVFRVGVRYLAARMPAEARELIEKAVARGFETDEVQFYRLLALLSGRTLRQLGNEGLDSLTAICAPLTPLHGDGEWAAGLRAVLALISSLPAADASLVDKELGSLSPGQRDLIVDHLGVLLEGPVEDEMWRRSVELAAVRQATGNRRERVWTFFQPVPARARARSVRPAAYQIGDLLRAGLGLVTFLFAIANVSVLLLRPGEAGPIIAFVVAAAGGALFVRHGARWYFQRQRVSAIDAELFAQPWVAVAPPDGFARAVDRLFDRYFGRYVPRGTDRDYWLGMSWGIRQRLRNEIVEIYREQLIRAEQIAWLIRHLVGDVRRGWEQNTLYAYRAELRTPPEVKAACVAELAAFGLGELVVMAGLPPAGVAWSLLAVVAGAFATRAGFRLDSERRRVGADTEERMVPLRAREEAYERWTRKLSVKPTDLEMADWLESDRRLLVNEALLHYRLAASQIIAQAVIEGPAAGAKRARVKHGPWRFSKYQMVLFLLTREGVRQITIHLDFEAATAHAVQRLTYRFDAVASVRIDGLATQRQTFALTLINGSPITMPVTEAIGELEPGEDPVKLSQVSLDASGLPHTLDVLEGIAAEGKEWVHHQHRRTEERLTDLSHAIRRPSSER